MRFAVIPSLMGVYAILFGLAPTSWADVDVHALKPNAPISGMSGTDRKLHPFKAKHSKKLPFTPEDRGRWLKAADLHESVAKWDAFRVDELILRSRNLSLEDLGAAYPDLDRKKISRLRETTSQEGKW